MIKSFFEGFMSVFSFGKMSPRNLPRGHYGKPFSWYEPVSHWSEHSLWKSPSPKKKDWF